ncbi:macro domain-containing protein [Vibrio mangrovi]|uniref:Macro domain-containing protein n=1 Tax=Vibrio mangrovi TaxID=474394 RepID=A0A1Y6INU6_9VIBR|nr:macro domain-containing protein [Vibrio mangrovi]MDW6003889.1 macro domain-containing protein [Vibrio mangrovi]SMR99317.1 O-acetyl-ADP-ribose deacetylase [Vibrio mangrovi]
MAHIEFIQGDIVSAQVDAIVNAANPGLLGGGGVDGAIHRGAGASLLESCAQLPDVNGIRCPVGEARITQAGKLNARYVIHTVGPIFHTDPAPALHLASAYRASLRLALANQCRSVALPAISCGIYGYPPHEAALIALKVCCEPEFHQLQLSFFLFSHEMYTLWQDAWTQIQKGASHQTDS